MAYGDSGSGDLSNKSVTFKGFSSRADKTELQTVRLRGCQAGSDQQVKSYVRARGWRIPNLAQ